MSNSPRFRPQQLSLTLSLLFASAAAFAADDAAKPSWDVNAPSGQFKTVQINTQSGTWMNLDISPDGKTVVFDLLGDLYTMPVTGGTPKRLTSDIGWQMQPTFSPDGKYIAYTSDEGGGDNIWLMNADGSNPHAVTNETFRLLNSPAWSPDGEFIVARKHFTNTRSLGAGEVWMYHKTGGSGVMLTAKANDEKDLGEPAFSPDGKYVYFSQDDTPGKTFHYSKDSEQGIYVIKRFERETGNIEVLLDGAGGAIRPTPSPDGNYLAFIRRQDFQSTLFIYDLKSGEEKAVYKNLDRDMQETWAIHGVYPRMTWSPDNKKLLFWAGGKIKALTVSDQQVQDIPFNIKVDKQIQTAVRIKQDINPSDVDVKMLRFVQTAPDGKTVIYAALGKLYQVDSKGGTPTRLTDDETNFELYPQFSRDGRYLVYTTWHDQHQGTIKIRDLKSGKTRDLLQTPGKYLEPTFSPDGKTVVFRKGGAGSLLDRRYSLNTGIYKVSVKGGEPVLLSRSGYNAHFGSSNDRVFAQDFAEQPTLLSIDMNTFKTRTLYSAKFGTELRVSPDNKFVAFVDRFKVYITPFVERGATIDLSGQDDQFPVKQLSVRAGENVSWASDSRHLYWNLGPELYHADISEAFAVGSSKEFNIKDGQAIGFKAKPYIPDGTVAFVGGKIITMDGDKVIEDGVVIVKGNTIQTVGSRNEVQVPAGAKVIDIKGKTLMPGLFDAHAHGSQGENQIIPQQNYIDYASLALGVTTIHDPSNDTREIFAASEMQKTGAIVGPRIFSTGTILYGAYGAGYTSHVDTVEDAKFHLERLKKVGAFSVKSYNQPRRNQRQQVIEAARGLNMMVVPEGGSLLQHNLTMAVDGHTTLEHSLPAAKLYDDVKQLWQASGTAYTPTLVVAYGGVWGENYWYDKTEVWKHPRLSKYVPMDILGPRSMRRPTVPDHHYNHFHIAKAAKELNDAGVVVNIGAHGQRESLGAHWEIWMMAQGGMSPLEALKTATINPAKTFGLDHQLGSVTAGKLADLIVIDGDPLTNIRDTDKVHFTMVNGALFDSASMNELNGLERKRQKFYFEKN